MSSERHEGFRRSKKSTKNKKTLSAEKKEALKRKEQKKAGKCIKEKKAMQGDLSKKRKSGKNEMI